MHSGMIDKGFYYIHILIRSFLCAPHIFLHYIRYSHTYVSMYTRTQQELTYTQKHTQMYGIPFYSSFFRQQEFEISF